MKKVLIFGAGSIGNHLAFACRKLSYEVWVTDKNSSALHRMKTEIYPQRYSKWDRKIEILEFYKLKKIDLTFDLIIIGTPPNTHINVYNFCKKHISFKKVLIEKPLFQIGNKKRNMFKNQLKKEFMFCGYNHSISKSFQYFEKKVIKKIKNIYKIQISWCESWKGILNAHFWLKSENSSYLGNYRLGGGALQEHSHGLHLLYLLLKTKNIDLTNTSIKKKIFFSDTKKYDLISGFSGYSKNIFFSYITDLITFPAEKKINIYGEGTKAEWICGFTKDSDVIRIYSNNKLKYEKYFKKSRSSEFENEISHIMNINNIKQVKKSNLYPGHAFKIVNNIDKIFKDEKK